VICLMKNQSLVFVEINMRYDDRRGINLISSGYDGQWKYLRTTDTTNLERVPVPFTKFQIWLGRVLVQLGL
jgi:hypothetical protein